jgi:hypothetical protein
VEERCTLATSISEQWAIPAVTRVDLEHWYTKLAVFPGFEMDHRTFMEHWGRADIIFTTEHGILKIDKIRPKKPAIAHALFWSPRVFRDLDTISSIIDYTFRLLAPSAIFVQIPGDQLSLARFVKRLGFVEDIQLPQGYVQFRRNPDGTADI